METNKKVFYNENDPGPADWLQNLMLEGLLDAGRIDRRSIEEIEPGDVEIFEECHFFAGIGGWPLALKLAGWEGPVWTGSCPCQSFSAIGKRRGFSDERHLWPVWKELIAECRPPTVFGEQVASKLGKEWLARVRADLEVLGYAVGAADLCAAGVGAPHMRQRLYWVGHAIETRLERHSGDGGQSEKSGRINQKPDRPVAASDGFDPLCFWEDSDAAVLYFPDGRTTIRRIEPRTFPVADGVPARVGRLRAYGEAVVPQLAAAFIRAFRGAL